VEQGIAFFPVVFGVLERGLSGLPDKMHQFQVYWPTAAELYSAPPHNISNPDQVRLCYKEVIDNDVPRHRFLSRLAMQMNKRFDEFLRDQATKSQSLEREGQQAEAGHNAEEERTGPGPQLTITQQQKITNRFGMVFVLIPTGSFTMGSRLGINELLKRFGGDESWYKRDKPSQVVSIKRPFYLQDTPVTQRQWQQLIGKNPSNFKDGGKNCPVELVSWEEAQLFINNLNEDEITDVYRLPSEAEWEYVCRAGSDAEFSFGDDVERLDEFAWYSKNSERKTHPVGEKEPNAWGLYDMHGNVREWVEDDWHDNYRGAPDDGMAWVNKPRGSYRVIRGGGWGDGARGCRSATRSSGRPGDRYFDVGFRLSRSVAFGT
jgi:formylglycine-generating enzyme required for sulfatase activity